MRKLLHQIHRLITKTDLPTWLIVFLVIIFILRVPSLFEPFYYGDEMIYLTLGEGIRQNQVLYKNLHDNKPPALYLLAALAGSIFWFKLILSFWVLITIIAFWKLSQTLFPQKIRLQKTAVFIFGIFTTLPLLEGNIANAELFMIGPIIIAFWLLLSKKLNPKNLFISGLLFSLATLFKFPAVFDLPAVIFVWLVSAEFKSKKIKKALENSLFLIFGFFTLLGLTFIWYSAKGGLSEYFIAAFAQNMGYLSSWRPATTQESFLVRNAPLLIRAGLVAAGLVILYQKRKRLSKQFIFITAWLLFSLFAATLSERPYPHYLIQVVPAVSFLVSILLTQKTKEQSFAILPLALAFLVPVYYRYWYYPTTSYYVRFLKLAGGKINRQEYLTSFGEHVPRAYKIADFIIKSTKRNEKIFVWGKDSQLIYALSRRLPPIRYVALYHINDFSNKKIVLTRIKNNQPKLIIILPDSPSFIELEQFLEENYLQISAIDGAQVWYLKQITSN